MPEKEKRPMRRLGLCFVLGLSLFLLAPPRAARACPS
jgi:hypothetical protein